MAEEKKITTCSGWIKPEVVTINLKEYENAILANARSGSSCGSCGNCGWSVGCKLLF